MPRLSKASASRQQQPDPEAGSFTLENAILIPVLLLLLFGAIQTGFWLHARDVARHTAQVAAQAAALEGASNSAGASAGQAFASRTGSLGAPSVTVTRSGTTVTATVTGTSPSFLPDWLMPGINQSATVAIEQVGAG